MKLGGYKQVLCKLKINLLRKMVAYNNLSFTKEKPTAQKQRVLSHTLLFQPTHKKRINVIKHNYNT